MGDEVSPLCFHRVEVNSLVVGVVVGPIDPFRDADQYSTADNLRKLLIAREVVDGLEQVFEFLEGESRED